jgi:hypothetical protein
MTPPIIKFRGQAIGDNNFVYGFYRHVVILDWLDKVNYDVHKIYDIETRIEHDVVKETVTQFVNVADKAGNELYVGDFIMEIGKDIPMVIFAVEGGFALNTPAFPKDALSECPMPLMPLADEQTISWIKGSCIKAGNVFDNKNLLKKLVDAAVGKTKIYKTKI